MPELPEVETVMLGIQSLVNESIKSVIIRQNKLRYLVDNNLSNTLAGQEVKVIFRRAKYLIIRLNNGDLIIHLGMSGSLTLETSHTDIKKHDHADFIFENYILRYNDPRRFGSILYTDSYLNHPLFSSLGVEPLEDYFNANYLFNKVKNRKTTIKQLIMDNRTVVGVGNIYACEALFMAKILPTRPGDSIRLEECILLVENIKKVLIQAINSGGSTLRDYKHVDGGMGSFQNVHMVYNKEGKACVYCHKPILALRIVQRNSFYCNSCQK